MSLIKSAFTVDRDAVAKMATGITKVNAWGPDVVEVFGAIVGQQNTTIAAVGRATGLASSRVSALLQDGARTHLLSELVILSEYCLGHLNEDGSVLPLVDHEEVDADDAPDADVIELNQ